MQVNIKFYRLVYRNIFGWEIYVLCVTALFFPTSVTCFDISHSQHFHLALCIMQYSYLASFSPLRFICLLLASYGHQQQFEASPPSWCVCMFFLILFCIFTYRYSSCSHVESPSYALSFSLLGASSLFFPSRFLVLFSLCIYFHLPIIFFHIQPLVVQWQIFHCSPHILQ